MRQAGLDEEIRDESGPTTPEEKDPKELEVPEDQGEPQTARDKVAQDSSDESSSDEEGVSNRPYVDPVKQAEIWLPSTPVVVRRGEERLKVPGPSAGRQKYSVSHTFSLGSVSYQGEWIIIFIFRVAPAGVIRLATVVTTIAPIAAIAAAAVGSPAPSGRRQC